MGQLVSSLRIASPWSPQEISPRRGIYTIHAPRTSHRTPTIRQVGPKLQIPSNREIVLSRLLLILPLRACIWLRDGMRYPAGFKASYSQLSKKQQRRLFFERLKARGGNAKWVAKQSGPLGPIVMQIER